MPRVRWRGPSSLRWRLTAWVAGVMVTAAAVVFVVVLVLLLKSFVAEAFVIPTGSMAETLYGYQMLVTCPKCKEEFPVNCSCEVDPQHGNPPSPVTACTCPNCRYYIDFAQEGKKPTWHTGDRVLVAKSVYDLAMIPGNGPQRRLRWKKPSQTSAAFMTNAARQKFWRRTSIAPW